MILLRSAAFNAVMYTTGLILSSWATLGRRTRPEHALHVGRSWARIVIAALRILCRIDLRVQGRGHLPVAGGALIAAQHQSALDIMVWLALLPRPAYVLKRELLSIPIFGPALAGAGMIAVDRAGGAGSLRKMVQECRAALADGRQIVIFPEGTRVIGTGAAKLQPGIVALAKALRIDITPAAIDSGRRWSRKAFIKTPGPVTLKIYPPIDHTAPREQILAQLHGYFYQG